MSQGVLDMWGGTHGLGISPFLELGAFEALWTRKGATHKSISELFRKSPTAVPSDFVTREEAETMADRVMEILRSSGVDRFGIRLRGEREYPLALGDADDPSVMLYYRGWWNLIESRCVAVVGTRKPSEDGRKRAHKLARLLVKDGWTVVSGLARGIDTEAHTAALEAGGRTIAVLGTPLCTSYPAENAPLQKRIADDFLVVSQVPVVRHSEQSPKYNRFFFPLRNVTMSALTRGTVIVEAGNTSGTLTQARAALSQRRKLFILEACFRDPELTWPKRFEEMGAVRVKDYEQISEVLDSGTPD